MYKRIIISLLVFTLIGELLIRFDEKFRILEENHVVKVEARVEITPEFNLVKNNTIDLKGNNLRIMVLGDSYIHGAGIEFQDNFSQQLKSLVKQANSKFDDVFVLDVSKPSSNTFDNNQTYFQFADKFKPHIVILGYFYNDVIGNLDKNRMANEVRNFSSTKASSEENRSVIKRVYDFIYHSKFMYYILYNLHKELKAHGIVLPNSEFNTIMKSYYDNKENWVKSKGLLKEIIEDAGKKDIQLVVLKFPEVNLLEHQRLYTRADEKIKEFFTSLPPVHYINGTTIFNGESSKDFILSKYDGHPNEKAHKKMADYIFSYIKRTNSPLWFNKANASLVE